MSVQALAHMLGVFGLLSNCNSTNKDQGGLFFFGHIAKHYLDEIRDCSIIIYRYRYIAYLVVTDIYEYENVQKYLYGCCHQQV